MSVTIAVPGIPVDGTVDDNNPLAQDGGVLSPGIAIMKAQVDMSGGDTHTTIDLDDYGLTSCLLYGHNVLLGGAITEDPTGEQAAGQVWINYVPETNLLDITLADGYTIVFQVWAIGRKDQNLHQR